MHQILVSRLILSKASSDLPTQHPQLSCGWLPPGIALGERITAGFQLGHLRLEEIYLPPGAGLSPIKRPCIQKEGARQLMALKIHHAGGHQRSHAPIKPKHRVYGGPKGYVGGTNLDDKIED